MHTAHTHSSAQQPPASSVQAAEGCKQPSAAHKEPGPSSQVAAPADPSAAGSTLPGRPEAPAGPCKSPLWAAAAGTYPDSPGPAFGPSPQLVVFLGWRRG